MNDFTSIGRVPQIPAYRKGVGGHFKTAGRWGTQAGHVFLAVEGIGGTVQSKALDLLGVLSPGSVRPEVVFY